MGWMGNGHLIGYTASLTTLKQREWNGAINQAAARWYRPEEFYKNWTENGKTKFTCLQAQTVIITLSFFKDTPVGMNIQLDART